MTRAGQAARYLVPGGFAALRPTDFPLGRPAYFGTGSEMPNHEIDSTDTREDLDLTRALEDVSVPAYVLDREGRFRWQNRGALRMFGNRLGQSYTRAFAPEDLHLAR